MWGRMWGVFVNTLVLAFTVIIVIMAINTRHYCMYGCHIYLLKYIGEFMWKAVGICLVLLSSVEILKWLKERFFKTSYRTVYVGGRMVTVSLKRHKITLRDLYNIMK